MGLSLHVKAGDVLVVAGIQVLEMAARGWWVGQKGLLAVHWPGALMQIVVPLWPIFGLLAGELQLL